MYSNNLGRTRSVVGGGHPRSAVDNLDERVAEGLRLIRDCMPLTYADIQAQATGARGKQAFALVRRALRGEPDCFYAVEAGHVVGTPFARSGVTDQVAALMVEFGCGFLVLWPAMEVVDGTH